MTGLTAAPTAQECRGFIAAIRAYRRAPERFTDGQLARLAIRPLAGGQNNAIYLCGSPDRRCCVKIYRTDDDRRRNWREWRALTLLAQHIPGLAPRPFWHDPDPHGPAVAMEYLTGRALRGLPPGTVELASLASRLQQLATLTPALTDYPFLIDGAPAVLRARLQRWADTLPAPALPILRAWLAGGDAALLARPAPLSFDTGDPNLANWLWSCESQTLQRIDWEYAGWSDFAYRLADLLEGPWAREIDAALWQGFLAHFDLNAPTTSERLGAARRQWAIFWVCKYTERREREDTAANRHLLGAQIAHARNLLDGRDQPSWH